MPRKKKTQPVITEEPQVQPDMVDTQVAPLEDTPVAQEENPQALQEEPQEQLEAPEEQPAEQETTAEDTGEPVEEDDIDESEIAAALEEQTGRSDADRQASIDRMMKAERLFKYAKDARRKYDREWLARDLFRRGYQFASHNQQTGTVTMSSRSNARIPVNLTWAYIRSIKNQVTSFNPKWEVMPEFKGKRSEMNARLAGKLLDYLFVKNNVNKSIKEAVIQGLITSVGGPFEVVWDPDYDNGPNQPRGEVVIYLHDPFDVYWDPNCTASSDANFVVKAIRTGVDEVKANQEYFEDIRDMITGGSPKKAESEYKQFLLQTVQNNQQQMEDNESLILKQIQWKEHDPESGRIKVRYLTWCDQVTEPLEDKLVDQEDFDMEVFQADMNPLEMYAESWSKHVIALNRVLNALESSIFDYNYRYAKGRLVIDKNSGVRAITNEHGSIIEKNRGAEVKPLPLQPLPSSVESQIIRIKAMMEDISGVHEATLGRTPPQIKSGIGIAELKQSDSTNQDDLVQNLEQCLMRLGQKVLKKAALHYSTPRISRVIGSGRMVEHFAVVGEPFISDDKDKWRIGEETYPLARISANNELQVNIGSWLAYSKEAQQKVLMDLAEAGIIDKETVLKYLEFPDIQDIMDRSRTQSLIEMKRKEEPSFPSGVNQEMLALAENEQMADGDPSVVDPEQDDHQLHIAIHNSALGKDETADSLVLAHIQEHRRAMQGGGQSINTQGAGGQQQPAQGGAPAPAQPLPPDQGMPPMPPPPGAALPFPVPGAQPAQPGVLPQAPTQRPEASFFSAGVQELPPTATTIVGGPGNAMPTA